MNTRILPVAVLALSIGLTASAQTKEKTPAPKAKTPKDETITIRKKAESKDKVTIVIDGDKVIVNGKPLDEMKDADIEVLREKSLAALPGMKGRIGPMGGIKMFGEDFPMGNSAFLGVISEKSDKGAKISSVEKESAAEKAGLKKDDIITKIGDEKIEGSDDLYEAIGKYKPEENVTITYLRDGKEAAATAILGKSRSSNMKSIHLNKDFNLDLGNELSREFNLEMPRQPRMNGMEFSYNRRPRLGLGIQDLEDGKGVKVLDVDEETPAAKAGLQKDDVISEVDGKAISSVDDLKTKVKDMKEGESIKITYTRAGKTQSAEIKLPKKIKTADL